MITIREYMSKIMQRVAISTVLLLFISLNVKAQLVAVIDTLEYGCEVTELVDEWIPSHGPWVYAEVTVINESPDTVLACTLVLKKSLSATETVDIHKEVDLMVQFEFEYLGKTYRNLPRSVWVSSDTMYYTDEDYLYEGNRFDALVIKPGESFGKWGMTGYLFEGTDIPVFKDVWDRDDRLKEWDRLCKIIEEVQNTIKVKVYSVEREVDY